MRTSVIGLAGIGGLSALLALGIALDGGEARVAPPPAAIESPVVVPVSADRTPTLSVMTYNIEGLPFPVRFGRAAAAGEIARRLRAMRTAGLQPHIVVLQEAFGDAQRAIGREAGYRYVAFGPGRDLTSPVPMDAADLAFAARASFFKGERSGKWEGSGLAILSDYPIVSVARAAFPAFACAGFDCLANKGVLLATVKVPGAPQPVAVIATHMNSKNASGVDQPRWDYAFMRQVAMVGRFLKGNLAAGTPYIFAGDTNIGKSPMRQAAFEAMLAGLPRAAGAGVVRTALSTCLDEADSACAVASPGELRKSYVHGKDWEVYAPGAMTAIAPRAMDAPFGHDADGHMLSDHIGYTAFYRLAAMHPARGGMIALRASIAPRT